MKQIALIKAGTTIEEIRHNHGDFEVWFAQCLDISNLLQIDVYKHQALPAAEDLAGVVITGSPAMVSEKQDWSECTAGWLEKAVRKGIPILGVCYGHQLLAHALGGRAGHNPAGRQIGTVTARLIDSAKDDPLLGHLPTTFAAQTSHSEVVLELPPDAQRLATSPLDDNFAIRYAENVWGVQFHPEFSSEVMSEYIRCRLAAIHKEGLNAEQLLEKTTETKEAKSVLQVFSEMLKP